MKFNRIITALAAGFVFMLMLMAARPVKAAGAENDGRLTVLLGECGIPEHPDTTGIHIYRFAEYRDDGGVTAAEEFSGFADEISVISDSAHLRTAAEDIQRYIIENGLAGRSETGYFDGYTEVSGLEYGVYLMITDGFESEHFHAEFAPSVFSITPEQLSVTIVPKSSVAESGIETQTGVVDGDDDTDTTTTVTTTAAAEKTTGAENTSETSTSAPVSSVSGAVTVTETSPVPASTTASPPPPERFPQTGTQMWLVFLLAAAGLILLISLIGTRRSERRKRNTALLAAALICFGSAGYLKGRDYIAERNSARFMTAAVEDIMRSADDAPAHDSNTPARDDTTAAQETHAESAGEEADTAAPMVNVNGEYYIGILRIPSLSLELPVAYECTLAALRNSPGCYNGAPGEPGFIIGAHNYGTHFGYIYTLSPGDSVTFTDVNGREYAYTVSDVSTAAPDEAAQVCEAGYPLTLFTCNYSGARRVIVWCEETDQPENA